MSGASTTVNAWSTPKAYLKNVDIEALRLDNPKALEARELRDTYHYFGCEPGFPTFRYDIVDAVPDPFGPFLNSGTSCRLFPAVSDYIDRSRGRLEFPASFRPQLAFRS